MVCSLKAFVTPVSSFLQSGFVYSRRLWAKCKNNKKIIYALMLFLINVMTKILVSVIVPLDIDE